MKTRRKPRWPSSRLRVFVVAFPLETMLKSFITLGVVVAALTFEHHRVCALRLVRLRHQRRRRGRCSIGTASAATTTGSRPATSSLQASTRMTRGSMPPCSRRWCASCATGQMPPARRPRPTRRRSTSFVSVARTALDRAARTAPNPGRRASPPAESIRIRQRRPRSAGSRGERRGAAAERHGRFRVRQQRRRAVDHARR